MLVAVVAVLERLPGDAVLDYEGVIWLVRQDGRILLYDQHGLEPTTWSSSPSRCTGRP